MQNNGVQNTGSGTITIGNGAVGDRATVYAGPERQREDTAGTAGASPVHIGVITVLSQETRALTGALQAAGTVHVEAHADGSRCYEAEIEVRGRQLRVAATQAADRGQRPAVLAFQRLQQYHAPAIVVLAGIAGGVHPAVQLGDVVVAREVIYYDLRKEAEGQTLRRGQTRTVPIGIGHTVNHFFSNHGEPYRGRFLDPDGITRECSVLPGMVASGEAVIADAYSPIRRYIQRFNDKTLAVETEAGGVAEAFHETAGNSGTKGWLAIRGISDHADAVKNDDYHDIASWHAAAVLLEMLPYLVY
jgi:adenosylhomocysteine nucleosidase